MTQEAKQRALLTKTEIRKVINTPIATGARVQTLLNLYEFGTLEDLLQAQLDKAWELAKKEGKRELIEWVAKYLLICIDPQVIPDVIKDKWQALKSELEE